MSARFSPLPPSAAAAHPRGVLLAMNAADALECPAPALRPRAQWCSNNSNGGGSGWELMVPGAPLFPVGLQLDGSVRAEGPSGAHPASVATLTAAC